MIPSLASEYKIVLMNTSFSVVAQFDSLISCNYTKKVNDVGSFSLSLNAGDPRCDLFTLDAIVLIYRRLPGLNVDWYIDFVGLHRSISYDLSDEGKYIFSSTGVCPNDFLSRTIINYPAAPEKSFKGNVAAVSAETAMKEFTEENCGYSATVANGREASGVLPNFTVEATTGASPLWEGDRAYQVLLTVLQEISKSSGMDFAVTYTDTTPGWLFKVYMTKIGVDRTTNGI